MTLRSRIIDVCEEIWTDSTTFKTAKMRLGYSPPRLWIF